MGRTLIRVTPRNFGENRTTATRPLAELEAAAVRREESVTASQALVRSETTSDAVDIRMQRPQPPTPAHSETEEKTIPSAGDLNLFVQGLMPEEDKVSGKLNWAKVRSIARFVGFVTNGER